MNQNFHFKKSILLIAVMCSTILVNAQRWEKVYTQTAGGFTWPTHHTIQQTKDLGYVIAADSSGKKGQVIKTDCNGDIQWKRSYNFFTTTSSIHELEDGGYIVSAAVRTTSFPPKSYDKLVRLNKFGDTLWTKSQGINEDGIRCAVTTFDKGFLIQTANRLIKRDSVGTLIWSKSVVMQYQWIVQTADSGFIAAADSLMVPRLIKFDKNGNRIWLKPYIGKPQMFCVQQTLDGGYIAVGGDTLATVIKTDMHGDILWTRSFSTAKQKKQVHSALSIVQTPDGGYAFTCSKDLYYVYVIKMDGLGNTLWKKEFRPSVIGIINTGIELRGNCIQTTKEGGLIILGNSIGNGAVYLIKTDANGFTMTDKIEGYVYNDLNGNCIIDSGEPKLANKMIHVSPGNIYATTDTNGFYSARTDTGTYSVSLVPTKYWTQVCPNSSSTYSVHFDTLQQNSSANNFGIQRIPNIQDLKISVACGMARVGSNHNINISYENVGSKTMSGSVKLKYDPVVTYSFSAPLQDAHVIDTLTWNFSNLLAGETRTIAAVFNVPANPGLVGIKLSHKAFVFPMVGDTASADNIDSTSRIIRAAYDPNFKEVSPKGIDSAGTINLNDSILSYTIHFQNTGTDTAINVVVRDTIIDKLDITTIEMGASSHKYIYRVYDPRILEITFPKIMLPDSITNEIASHAFVKFKIKQNTTNQPGDVIKNKVDIWFDFNAPVPTEKAINTIATVVGITQINYDENIQVNIYPNPFNESATFVITEQQKPANGYNFAIFDIYGREVQKFQSLSNSFEFFRDRLNTGIYLYQILSKDNTLISTGKVIIAD